MCFFVDAEFCIMLLTAGVEGAQAYHGNYANNYIQTTIFTSSLYCPIDTVQKMKKKCNFLGVSIYLSWLKV